MTIHDYLCPTLRTTIYNMKYLLILTILLIGFCTEISAQVDTSFSNIQRHQFTNIAAKKGDTLLIDSLTIFYSSVEIVDQSLLKNLDKSFFKFSNLHTVTPSLSFIYSAWVLA